MLNIFGLKIKHSLENYEDEDNYWFGLEKNYGKEFVDIYKEVKPYTMLTLDAAYANYKIVNYLEDNNIEGDIIECGVWKGGSCMLIAKTLMKRGNTSRKIHLYDTFAGMTEPTEKDDSAIDNRHAIKLMQDMKNSKKYTYGETNWCEAGIDEVKTNIQKKNYPLENIYFIKGKVEETLPPPPAKITQIAFLRLDTDWYESTTAALVSL